MNKLGHVLFSTLIFIFIYVVISNNLEIDISKVLIAYFIFIIYSLIPDLDKNNSWIRKQFNTIVILLILFFTVLSIVNNDKTAMLIAGILISVIMFLTVVKHRGPVHSLSFGIIASAPLLFIDPFFFFVGVIGVLTHLLADMI